MKRAQQFLVAAMALAGCAGQPGPAGAAGAGAGAGSGGGGIAGAAAGAGGSAGAAGATAGAPMAGAGGGGTGGGEGGRDAAVGGPPDAARQPDAIGDDAAPTSGAVVLGGPALPCKFALCESFEEGTEGQPPDPAVWSPTGKSEISSVHAARGSKALHIPAELAATTYIRETKTFPALARGFYSRVFFWIDRQPMERPSTVYHWTVIDASDSPGGGGRELRMGGHIDAQLADWLHFNYNSHTAAGESGTDDRTALLSPKRWYCLEAYYSMTDNEARFWLDGVERPMLHWSKNDPALPFPAAVQSLSFGWTEYQPPQTPWEVWIDEIAVDAQRIGCDR